MVSSSDPGGIGARVLADHRVELFPDELFVELFPSDRGRPSIPGEVICSAMLHQELEGLSDRQAADALRRDIAWKIACGLVDIRALIKGFLPPESRPAVDRDPDTTCGDALSGPPISENPTGKRLAVDDSQPFPFYGVITVGF
ncbi:MAG: hypothetical protein NVS3B21_29900 [Acidimicrobiales bacterium]